MDLRLAGNRSLQEGPSRKEDRKNRKLRAQYAEALNKQGPAYKDLADGVMAGLIEPGDAWRAASKMREDQQQEAENLRRAQANASFIKDPTIAAMVASGAMDFNTGYNLWKDQQPGSVDPTSAMQEFNYAKSQGYDGSFADWQGKNVDPNAPDPKDVFGNESDLFKQYVAADPVKQFYAVKNGYERVRASADQGATNTGDGAGAADISLIFAYMKMLDPTSVVREGEFATAENAGGVGANARPVVLPAPKPIPAAAAARVAEIDMALLADEMSDAPINWRRNDALRAERATLTR